MTLEVQFTIMISMVLGGVYLGLALETHRRLFNHLSRLLFIYAMEITFWMTQAFILFYILYRVNGGEIRFYNILAVLLGFSMYQVFMATIYKKTLEKLIVSFTNVYKFVAQVINIILIKPVMFLFQLIITCLLFLFNSLFFILSFLIGIIMAPLRWALKYIYKLLPGRFQRYLYKIIDFYSIIKNTCKKVVIFLKRKRR